MPLILAGELVASSEQAGRNGNRPYHRSRVLVESGQDAQLLTVISNHALGKDDVKGGIEVTLGKVWNDQVTFRAVEAYEPGAGG